MATRQPTLESHLSEIGVETGRTVPEAKVERTFAPFVGRDSEPFETLRDALKHETRLRVRPPEPWRCETDTRREKLWLIPGYGSHVRLTTDGVRDGWTLRVDGQVEREDVSRLEAFEAAAERMSEIAGHVPAEVDR